MSCETCDGARVLVGTQDDGRGGDKDVIEPCPDCTDLEAWAAHRAWVSSRVRASRRSR